MVVSCSRVGSACTITMADVKWREGKPIACVYSRMSDRYIIVLHSYVANCIALDKPVTVSSFILEEKDFILKHVQKGERIQAILPKRLQTITQELNVTLVCVNEIDPCSFD